MGPIAFFGTIHESHCTISANFYLYLQYFQQKVFNFSKISGFQTNHWNYLWYLGDDEFPFKPSFLLLWDQLDGDYILHVT